MPFKQLARRATKHNLSETGGLLTEAMLKDEFSRMLTVSNENEGMHYIRFNFHLREYKPITTFDTSTLLIEGSVDHKTIEELPFLTEESDTSQVEDEEGHDKKVEQPELVKNQFNFSDRGSQTTDYHPREQLMQTEPPATTTFSASSSLGSIYDVYIKQINKQEVEKETDPPKTLRPSVNRLAAIIGRMIYQNLYDHLLQDFKYYDDPADDLRGNIGCLLPLWKFASDQTRDLSVTSVCWSPQYSDLFAVSFGSFSFSKQGEGAILLYSLKNPSHPTHTFLTECGVMSVDINGKFSNYMCAGFYDGSVAVYNLCHNTCEPEQQSKRGVHSMYISQIQWDKNITDEQLSCYSVSPDGLIVKWTLMENNLKHHIIMSFDISDFIEKSMVEMQITTFGSGLTLDFHASNKHLYLVGTEMGHAYLCLRTHSTDSLQTFDAHQFSVYKIAWNTFHPKIFITCSEDWTVKIWEHEGNIQKPLIVFDLGSQVYDVEWAPFSSTVFAAVTANGQVFVYDLAIDKNEPLCEQVVVVFKKTRAMYVTFNRLHPVILVGDDRGEVTCLKLSPNLRKEKKGQVPTDKKGKELFEKDRLDDILATIREKYD